MAVGYPVDLGAPAARLCDRLGDCMLGFHLEPYRRLVSGALLLAGLCTGCSGPTPSQPTPPAGSAVSAPPIPTTPAANISIEPGEYRLTFEAATDCEPLSDHALTLFSGPPQIPIPEALHVREYLATITKQSGTSYSVKPHETPTCRSFGFVLDVGGHDVSFSDDMGFWEVLPDSGTSSSTESEAPQSRVRRPLRSTWRTGAAPTIASSTHRSVL